MGRRAGTGMWAQVRPNVHTSRSHSAVLFWFIVASFFWFCGRCGHTTHRHTYQPSDGNAPHHSDQHNAERHQPQLDPAALSKRAVYVSNASPHAIVFVIISIFPFVRCARLFHCLNTPIRSSIYFLAKISWYVWARSPAVRTHTTTADAIVRLAEANTSDATHGARCLTTYESASAELCERRVFSIVSWVIWCRWLLLHIVRRWTKKTNNFK